jgi:hypothetical protein
MFCCRMGDGWMDGSASSGLDFWGLVLKPTGALRIRICTSSRRATLAEDTHLFSSGEGAVSVPVTNTLSGRSIIFWA